MEEHRAHAPPSVVCAVVTVSTSRTRDTDESGARLSALLRAAGHRVGFYALVKDDGPAILAAVREASQTCDAIITNGGTGLSRSDVTIETLRPELEKTLPGFGELFRALSHREIGTAAMLSGAMAGVFHGRLLFCLPGSPEAVEMGTKSLILPELGHAVGVMRR